MKLPNSLIARIWGPFLILAVTLSLLVGVYVPSQQRRSLVAFQQEELSVIAGTVGQAIEVAFANNDIASAQRYFNLLRERESITFVAYRFKGDTAITSVPAGITVSKIQSLTKDPLFVRRPFIAPLEQMDIEGEVLIKGADDYVNRELAKVNIPLYSALALVLLTVGLVYVFLRYRVSGPLMALKETAENIRTGDLVTSVTDDSRIAEVRSLNLALERLRRGLFDQRETNKLLTRGMEEEIERQTKDLRKTLNELKDSRNLFGSVIESALDAVVLADGQGRIMEWNRKAENIFGWTREETIGKALSEMIVPHGYREAHEKGMHAYHATGHRPVLNKSFEIQALRKSGEVFDIELYITDVKMEGEVIFSSFIRDITDSKELASNIERQRKLYESLLDGLPLMASLKNQNLEFTFVNDVACRVLGKSKEEMLGKKEVDIFDAPWVQQSIELDQAGYEGKKVANVERTFEVDGHSEKYLIGRYRFTVDEKHHLLTYGFNVTQLKAVQSELEEALHAKDEFLATISHEIRTPLHSIIVLAELMQSEKRQSEYGDFAENIRTSSRQLLDLVNDLLDFSKAEAGKLTLDPESIDLDSFFNGINRMDAHRRLETVEFVKDIEGCEGHVVHADRTRLNQILSNLLSNAFKFTEKGAVELRVTGKQDGNILRTRWTIKDTGIGISEKDQGRIFEAFQQAHTGISRQYGGTGLGLGIVVRILKLMGTNLQLTSELGTGTEFSFPLDLPLAETHAPLEMAAPQDRLELQDLKILYVEDMLPNQLVMKAMCKPWPVSLTIASSGLEAIELCKNHVYDLILMDIQMPEIDGVDTLHRIVANGGDIPKTYAFTAHAGKEDKEKFEKLGFAGVVTKPITPGQLEAFLRKQGNGHNRN